MPLGRIRIAVGALQQGEVGLAADLHQFRAIVAVAGKHEAAAVIFETVTDALRGVHGLGPARMQPGEIHFLTVEFPDLPVFRLQREPTAVGHGLVFHEAVQAGWAPHLQRAGSLYDPLPGSVDKQVIGQVADVIRVKMGNENMVNRLNVDAVFRHPAEGAGADIDQDAAGRGVQQRRTAGTRRVWGNSAGAEEVKGELGHDVKC